MLNWCQRNSTNGTGYKFLPSESKEYPHLTAEDKVIFDTVIKKFGNVSKNEIVDTMHKEDAYIETPHHDIIQFKYAKTLSLE